MIIILCTQHSNRIEQDNDLAKKILSLHCKNNDDGRNMNSFKAHILKAREISPYIPEVLEFEILFQKYFLRNLYNSFE